jgi:hypothetical protein
MVEGFGSNNSYQGYLNLNMFLLSFLSNFCGAAQNKQQQTKMEQLTPAVTSRTCCLAETATVRAGPRMAAPLVTSTARIPSIHAFDVILEAAFKDRSKNQKFLAYVSKSRHFFEYLAAGRNSQEQYSACFAMYEEWLTKHPKACFWLFTRQSTFVKTNTMTAVRFLSSLVSQHGQVLKRRMEEQGQVFKKGRQPQQMRYDFLHFSRPRISVPAPPVAHVSLLPSTTGPAVVPVGDPSLSKKESSARRNPVRSSTIHYTWIQGPPIASMFLKKPVEMKRKRQPIARANKKLKKTSSETQQRLAFKSNKEGLVFGKEENIFSIGNFVRVFEYTPLSPEDHSHSSKYECSTK